MCGDRDRREDRELSEIDGRGAGVASSAHVPVVQQHDSGEHERQDRERQESVRDAAAILDADTKRNGDDVDIRKVRADDQRRSCKRRSAFETALRERQADERVGEVVHPLRAEIGNGKWEMGNGSRRCSQRAHFRFPISHFRRLFSP